MTEFMDSLLKNPVAAVSLFLWSIILVYLIVAFIGDLVQEIVRKNKDHD